MELATNEAAIQASRQHYGQQTFDVSAGQSLKIETSPGGVEILDEECLAGKEWAVVVYVAINERDI